MDFHKILNKNEDFMDSEESIQYDSIVNSIIHKFQSRSKVGKEKYGTDLDRTDLSFLQWINHAQEEAMDFILYLEKMKKEYEKNAKK